MGLNPEQRAYANSVLQDYLSNIYAVDAYGRPTDALNKTAGLQALQALVVQVDKRNLETKKMVLKSNRDAAKMRYEAAEALARIGNATNLEELKQDTSIAVAKIRALTVLGNEQAIGWAPLIATAENEARKADGAEQKVITYWATLAEGLTTSPETIADPSGTRQAFMYEYIKGQGRDWRDELKSAGVKPTDTLWKSLEDIEMGAERQIKGIRVAQAQIRRFEDVAAQIQAEAAAGKTPDIEPLRRLATEIRDAQGLDVKTAADVMRATETLSTDSEDTMIKDIIKQLQKEVFGSTSDFKQTLMGKKADVLQRPDFQAWAKERGLEIGQVETDANGEILSVISGKDDALAIKQFAKQLERDPLARQRRFGAPQKAAYVEWQSPATIVEAKPDYSEYNNAAILQEGTTNNGQRVVTIIDPITAEATTFVDGAESTDPGAVRAEMQQVGRVVLQTADQLSLAPSSDTQTAIPTFMSYEEAVARARSRPGALTTISDDTPEDKQFIANYKRSKDTLAANSKKVIHGEVHRMVGIDLGLHARGGRVVMDENGKRVIVPADAKVTHLREKRTTALDALDALRAENATDFAAKRLDPETAFKLGISGLDDAPTIGERREIKKEAKADAAERERLADSVFSTKFDRGLPIEKAMEDPARRSALIDAWYENQLADIPRGDSVGKVALIAQRDAAVRGDDMALAKVRAYYTSLAAKADAEKQEGAALTALDKQRKGMDTALERQAAMTTELANTRKNSNDRVDALVQQTERDYERSFAEAGVEPAPFPKAYAEKKAKAEEVAGRNPDTLARAVVRAADMNKNLSEPADLSHSARAVEAEIAPKRAALRKKLVASGLNGSGVAQQIYDPMDPDLTIRQRALLRRYNRVTPVASPGETPAAPSGK